MWARLVAVATGIWLMAAPAVLGYADDVAATSDRIAGPIGGSLAFIAIWGVCRPLRWGTVPVGVWLVVAPWFLGFPGDATLSSVLAGLVLLGTSLVRGNVGAKMGGGWSALTEPFPGR